MQLPDCVRVTASVLLGKKAQAAYDRLEHEMLLEVDEQTIDAGSAAALQNKLL